MGAPPAIHPKIVNASRRGRTTRQHGKEKLPAKSNIFEVHARPHPAF
jgi:hypothetical protein